MLFLKLRVEKTLTITVPHYLFLFITILNNQQVKQEFVSG
jgi:hypothetical protein